MREFPPISAREDVLEFQYAITLDDYTEANKLLLLNTTFGRKFNYYAYFRVLPIVSVVLLLLAAVIFFVQGRRGLDAVLPLLFLGVIWLLCCYSCRRKIGKSYRMQKLGKECIAEVNPSGISVTRLNGEASGRFAWTAIDKHLETERLFVLLPSQMQFIPIPKRGMTPEQIDEFRGLLATHVVAS